MNKTQETQLNTEGGNNQPPLLIKENKVFKSRKWIFTYNNYENTKTQEILCYLKKSSSKFIFGYEIGSNGTPHLQGYMEFKNPVKDETLRNNGFDKCYLTNAKGTLKQNFDYTTKDGTFEYGGFELDEIEKPDKKNKDEYIKYMMEQKKKTILENIYKDVKMKPLQQKIIDIIESESNNRTINWIIDYKGNYGKSFLTKYLFCKENGIIVNGKTNDIFNSLNNYQLENDFKDPKFVIIDIPRSSKGYTEHLYNIMEKIKDGLLYSGKYEGGTILYEKPPHIIVFSNEEPSVEKMSKDRWNIMKVEE